MYTVTITGTSSYDYISAYIYRIKELIADTYKITGYEIINPSRKGKITEPQKMFALLIIKTTFKKNVWIYKHLNISSSSFYSLRKNYENNDAGFKKRFQKLSRKVEKLKLY